MGRALFKSGVLAALLMVVVSATAQAQSGGFSELVLKFPVTDKEMSGDDIDEAIRSKSIEVGINHVFFAPLYKQVEAITGEKYRHMTIHHLCDARLAQQLADLNDDLVVMMPCRIAVVESMDKPGEFSIYSTSPKVLLDDPTISQEQKQMILKFMPKMQALTEAVAAGDF